ncbi:MAG TPA: alpha/beta hydrolase [Polyangia bacterium]
MPIPPELVVLWPRVDTGQPAIRIFGAFVRPPDARLAALLMHPMGNFQAHYLLAPLAARGIAALGLNSRYLGNESAIIMERVIQDLGAGVRWLRDQGFERVILIGNSGGGALSCFYQAQAERLTIERTPADDPVDLRAEDLPAAGGLVIAAAHLGRSRLMDTWNDPSVIDEADPLGTDPTLDMYDAANGPPFSEDFLTRFRAAQRARNARIEARARARLRYLRALPKGPRDEAFIIYRTMAEPRSLDPTLEPSDRPPGMTIWGDPRPLNRAAYAMGRFTTLTSYLSQWSRSSNADGPANLRRTTVPVLQLEYTADASIFPGDQDEWEQAAWGRTQRHRIKGGTHFLAGQPGLIEEVADRISVFSW